MNKENLHYDRIGCVLLLSLFIFILSFFLCDIPKKFSVPLGLICFLFELAAVTSKGNTISSCIFYTILSPLAFVVLYLWILYLLNHIETLPISFRHTVIFAISAIIAVDFIYYKLVLCSTSVGTINSISTSDTLIVPPEPEIILPESSNNSQENFISKNGKLDKFSENIKSDIFIDEFDVYFEDAARFVIEKQQASVGMLQRLFKIGYNRAERIMDQLSDVGVVGPEVRTKPRKVLMTSAEFETAFEQGFFTSLQSSLALEHHTQVNEQSLNARVNYYNEKFDYMSGKDFEQYCAQLLHEVGFSDVTVTPASGDFGVDILGKYNNVLYAFQCKRYSSNVGVDAVYQISGGMKYYHANVGVVLTNQYYTEQAQQLASEIGVVLWDRNFLYDLIDTSISGRDLVSLMFKTKT